MQETQETWVWTLGREDPLEEKIPWKEEPGELQSMGSQRLKHGWMNEHAFWVREDRLCHFWVLVCYALWGQGSVLSVSVRACWTLAVWLAHPAGMWPCWRTHNLKGWFPNKVASRPTRPWEILQSADLSWESSWNNVTCSNMDAYGDYHRKWGKSDKDKYHMISLICKIWKKWYRWTYLQNWNRLTDLENKFMGKKKRKQTYNSQRGNVEGRINWEFGIDIYTWTHCIAWASRWL